MSIQTVDQARSFVESYYEAERANAFVCSSDTGYSVCQDKKSLRTKQIAKLASEALQHISKPKDLLHLYDAVERHVHRLDPTVSKFLRKIPFINDRREEVLSLPFTASACLLGTMSKIDTIITGEWLENVLSSEQDFEDFGFLEEWLNRHRNPTNLTQFIAGCNKKWVEIQRASTLIDLLQIAERGVSCNDIVKKGTVKSEVMWIHADRVAKRFIDILKKKIEIASSEIPSLGAYQLCAVAGSIEKLETHFQETRRMLNEGIKERIASEISLSGLLALYNYLWQHSFGTFLSERIEGFVFPQIRSLIKERIREICFSQLEDLDSLEKLLKIPPELLIQASFICDGKFKIWDHIKDLFFLEIARAETLERLNQISESLRSISSKSNHCLHASDFRLEIVDKKQSKFLQVIQQAKTLSQLVLLKQEISSDPDLYLSNKADLENMIAQQMMRVEKTLSEEVVGKVKILYREVDYTERKSLKKLPESSLLRHFAEKIPRFIKGKNVALLLGLQDLSDNAAVTAALSKLAIDMHPDNAEAEYKQVAIKLWKIFEVINVYCCGRVYS